MIIFSARTTMGKVPSHFLLALWLSCFLTTCSAIPRRTNITTDQSSLLSLKSHITQDPLQILSKNWSVGSSVCEWIGVTCGARHLRVTALNISNMNLTGTIPPQLGNLSFLASLDMSSNNFQGDLPVEFALFRRLKVLSLGYNNLSGQIPPCFGFLHELEYLSLPNNTFTGLIPASISNMTKLAYLNLGVNSLQGNIPAEFFNISSLQFISLAMNNLTGALPDNLCQNLRRLEILTLSWNKLSGQIPWSLGQCSGLQKLSLSFNKFTGEVPKEIGNLKALEVLYMGVNLLEGTIPKTIGNLTNLEVLRLSDNHLTGEIPNVISNLTMLGRLFIDGNYITGVIPSEINNLYNIKELFFGRNMLNGLIPIGIFNLTTMSTFACQENQLFGNLPSTMGFGLPNLERIYLNSNNFVGPIPSSISNSSKLWLIELSRNNFSGPIPNSLGDLSLLQGLNLQENNLTSDSSVLTIITSLANCKNLTVVSLTFNPLNAILPYSIGNLSTSLQLLELRNCNVKGTIPSGIGNLSSLVRLLVGDNQLSGLLPTTIEHLQNVQVIDLGRNRLWNSLHLFCTCKNLGELDFEENNILGRIPECLGNITSMRYLYLGFNNLSSTLPENLWNLKDLLDLSLSSNLLSGSLPLEIGSLKMARLMDLSRNNFEGGIPSTIGDMLNLQHLSLAQNRLQGSIPETMGKMLSLEGLDLSHNFLSGPIPISLEALQYLIDFNVSFNNLSGEIPSQGPFPNFTAESFISSGALCGIQKFHVPPCPRISTHKGRTKKMHVLVSVWVGVIMILGSMSFGFVYLRYRRKGKPPNVQADLSLVSQERISYYKLERATDGYHERNLLGTGSFGSVYKGTLDDGRTVAVKVFNLQIEGGFKSFDAECEALRNLRHRNLTKVISSCSNPDFKALVLEYMPNGSLEKWLYSHDCFLNVMQRLEILIDVACALQYLHCENPTPVVHCDLKPSNVLLDQDMIAHVSDFGVAKLLDSEDSFTFTKTLTTLCYVAPEFGLEGFASTKCDVYSFGIMIMEVFTRTSPSNEMFGENLDMKSWVRDSIPNTLANVIDANLLRSSGEYFPKILECISSTMEVALNCTRESPKERSHIRDVVASLNKIKLQLLPHKQGLTKSKYDEPEGS